MKLYQKVILCCLFAPIIHINFSNLFIYGVDVAMGFKPDKVTYFGVLGCYTYNWQYLVINSATLTKSVIMLIVGYYLNKHPNENYKLIGALLFFVIPFGYARDLAYFFLFKMNPINSWILKEEWKQVPIILFKTYYNYKLVFNFLALTYSIVSLYLCYKVICYYWNPHFRFLIFTLGVMVSAASTMLWYMCIGPLVY